MTLPKDRLADLRAEYTRAALDVGDVLASPFGQFARWFDEAVAADVPEPSAMTLATVAADGRPAARIVLLKGVDPAGFVFYTNYASRKGRELAECAHAALLFFWAELERQVRIEGVVARVDAAESDAYFASRPRLSRIGAWASPQSEMIADRAWLEASFARFAARHPDPGEDVPRPPHWGGYRVAPDALEFWQGRASRLHDRIAYLRDGQGWRIVRLAP
jgi:pyridoxamine 5'-phosphate oxidase